MQARELVNDANHKAGLYYKKFRNFLLTLFAVRVVILCLHIVIETVRIATGHSIPQALRTFVISDVLKGGEPTPYIIVLTTIAIGGLLAFTILKVKDLLADFYVEDNKFNLLLFKELTQKSTTSHSSLVIVIFIFLVVCFCLSFFINVGMTLGEGLVWCIFAGYHHYANENFNQAKMGLNNFDIAEMLLNREPHSTIQYERQLPPEASSDNPFQ